jgi:hypothetical protein
MKANYQVTGQDRKKLVGIISATLNQPTTYCGAPSFQYRVGDYSISKTGEVTGPDNEALIAALLAEGFWVADETAAQGFASENQPEDEFDQRRGVLDTLVGALNEDADGGDHWGRLHNAPTIVDGRGREHNLDGTFAQPSAYARFSTFEKAEGLEASEPADRLTIEMPLEGFTPESLDNLTKMVAAKEPLLKIALGVDALPIQVLEDRIAFPWFEFTDDSETVNAYAQLIAALCRTAKEKQRVTAKPREDYANARFSCRTFLIQLGLIGPEFKKIRHLLTSTLPGNGAFSRGFDPRKVQPEAATEEMADGEVNDPFTETEKFLKENGLI